MLHFICFNCNKCNDAVKVAVVVAQVDKGFDEHQFISRKKPNNTFRWLKYK